MEYKKLSKERKQEQKIESLSYKISEECKKTHPNTDLIKDLINQGGLISRGTLFSIKSLQKDYIENRSIFYADDLLNFLNEEITKRGLFDDFSEKIRNRWSREKTHQSSWWFEKEKQQ